jgi:protoporphyrinogen oxidase
MLALLLSLPVATAACNRKPRVPPGEIPFRPELLGHQLRDGTIARPSLAGAQKERVVIVGGGVAGLSAARRLTRAGFSDYVMIELDTVLGGTARQGSFGPSLAPWGAHYVTLPMAHNKAFIRLLDEAGAISRFDASGEPVASEAHLCRDPEERIFHEDEWHEGLIPPTDDPKSQAELARFNSEIDALAALRDQKGRRAFALPRALASTDADILALDKTTFADWLDKKGFQDARVRWLTRYACRDDYGTTPEHTSAWAGLFYFASRKQASGKSPQPVLTWPEGNGRLVSLLSTQSDGRRMLGTGVTQVTPRGAERRVSVCAQRGDGTSVCLDAEHVIFAAPQLLAKVLIDSYRSQPHVQSFDYSPWMVANVTLAERPRRAGFPFAWDSVLAESPSLGYVTATHQTGQDHGPTVLTYYYPLTGDDVRAERQKLLSLGRDEWADVALTDLATAHPDIFACATRVDVMRWGHAMVRPVPGLHAALEKARAPFQNVHFANTDLSGLALFEEAFFHGIRAAEEVLTARQIPFESWL